MAAKVKARRLTAEEKVDILLMVMNNVSSRGLSGAMVYDRMRNDGKLPGRINQSQVNRFLRVEAEIASKDPDSVVFDVIRREPVPLHDPPKDAYIIGVKRGRTTYYQRNPGKPIPSPRFWNGGLIGDPIEAEPPPDHVESEPEVHDEESKPTKLPVNPGWVYLAKKVIKANESYVDFTHRLRIESNSGRDLAKKDIVKFQLETMRCWNSALFQLKYSSVPPGCVCVCIL